VGVLAVRVRYTGGNDRRTAWRATVFTLPLRDNATLEPLEPWQAAEFGAHLERAREHIRPWVGAGFVGEDVRGTLERYAEGQAADRARLYGIRLDGVLVGGVMFVDFDASSGTCEIGCWLEPGAEGLGLVTAACRVLIEWAFTVRGMSRVEWRCRGDNVRSAAVAERLGMTLEGVLRKAWLNGGVRHDKQVWAILCGERVGK
jgi:RimJ/RimL family protein N-acetyltransferase